MAANQRLRILASAFGLRLPFGFGHDFAGVVDDACDHSLGYQVGGRVFGSVWSRAAADHLIISAQDSVHCTPAEICDETASTLTVARLTASAAIAAVNFGPNDTVVVGGAAGGVGVFAVQLARLRGARVLGTGAPATAPFLRKLGATPIAYGPGLTHPLHDTANLTAAIDLFGTDTGLLHRSVTT